MEIQTLTAEAFRNIVPVRLDFHPRLNLILGDNGQGKTNLLEAMALLSGRPSFRTADLTHILRGRRPAVLSARLGREGEAAPASEKHARFQGGTLGVVVRAGAREHTWEGRRITRAKASLLLPAVFLTAQDLSRLGGPPAERRRALDRTAHWLVSDHGKTVLAYERARLSKNRLLSLGGRYDPDEMAVYEDALAVQGARIAGARRRALEALEPELRRQAERLGFPHPDLALALVSDLPATGTPAEFEVALREGIRRRESEERRAERSLVGPHRDDVLVEAGDAAVFSRASSGEVRTLLLAWTLSELALLKRARGSEPILAFDDFDSEWDPRVLALFAEALPESSQLFLTSARPDAVRNLPLPSGAVFRMVAGRLQADGVLGAGRASRGTLLRMAP